MKGGCQGITQFIVSLSSELLSCCNNTLFLMFRSSKETPKHKGTQGLGFGGYGLGLGDLEPNVCKNAPGKLALGPVRQKPLNLSTPSLRSI